MEYCELCYKQSFCAMSYTTHDDVLARCVYTSRCEFTRDTGKHRLHTHTHTYGTPLLCKISTLRRSMRRFTCMCACVCVYAVYVCVCMNSHMIHLMAFKPDAMRKCPNRSICVLEWHACGLHERALDTLVWGGWCGGVRCVAITRSTRDTVRRRCSRSIGRVVQSDFHVDCLRIAFHNQFAFFYEYTYSRFSIDSLTNTNLHIQWCTEMCFPKKPI